MPVFHTLTQHKAIVLLQFRESTIFLPIKYRLWTPWIAHESMCWIVYGVIHRLLSEDVCINFQLRCFSWVPPIFHGFQGPRNQLHYLHGAVDSQWRILFLNKPILRGKSVIYQPREAIIKPFCYQPVKRSGLHWLKRALVFLSSTEMQLNLPAISTSE